MNNKHETTIPPGEFAKNWFLKNRARLVETYGKLEGERIAYLTAWKLNESVDNYLDDDDDDDDEYFDDFDFDDFDLQLESIINGNSLEEIEDSIVKFLKTESTEDDDGDGDDGEEDLLGEALNREQRRKRGLIARRNRAKLQRGRKLASKRRASPDKIKNRARKQARKLIMKKLMRGRNLADLNSAEKQKLETRVDKMKGLVDRLAKKLIVKVRQKEQEKLATKNKD